LLLGKTSKPAASVDQFVERALFDYSSHVEDKNAGSLAHRRQTMRNDEGCAAFHYLIERAQDNTRKMLEGMMGGLGFERVTVRFEQPKV